MGVGTAGGLGWGGWRWRPGQRHPEASTNSVHGCGNVVVALWPSLALDLPGRVLSCPYCRAAHACGCRAQVWQFTLTNVEFKLNASGTGSMQNAPEIKCDKVKVVCIDAGLVKTGP